MPTGDPWPNVHELARQWWNEVELNVPMIMIGLKPAATTGRRTLAKRSKTFLYLDLKTNRLLERDPQQDRENQIRKQLKNQANQAAE